HIGQLSVAEAENDIREALKDTHILFIVAGLGKGTGSGASPEIAKIAKSMGILTVAIVNLPSVHAEGSSIYQNALKSYETLSKEVNSITAISNERIIRNNKEEISFVKAFEKANAEVKNTVSEIVDLVTGASEMNMDFADTQNFFLRNSAFLATTIELKNDLYSKEKLYEIIKDAIDASYSNMNIKNLESMQIMANFTICVNTPGSLVVDTRNAFKQITGLNNLTLVSGVDYSGTDTIKISLLLSANSQNVDNEKNNDTTESILLNKSQPRSFSAIDLEMSNEADLEQYKTNPIDDNSGVEKRTFKFSTFDLDDIPGSELDSTDANKLITRAMTEIIQDNNITNENEVLKKNN
ncbi:MAG: hypothetical protein LBV37_00090, partial [Mycoplasmataceae bacterium]|nr:hypothetical protein [Mycoplasmataceae bacterium]